MNILCHAGHPKPWSLHYPLGDGPCPTCTPKGKMPVRTPAVVLTVPIKPSPDRKLRDRAKKKGKNNMKITKQSWLDQAKNIAVTIDGQPHVAVPKLFSTGSVGYMLSGKTSAAHPGTTQDKIQMSCSLVVVGSKEWVDGDLSAYVKPPKKGEPGE